MIDDQTCPFCPHPASVHILDGCGACDCSVFLSGWEHAGDADAPFRIAEYAGQFPSHARQCTERTATHRCVGESGHKDPCEYLQPVPMQIGALASYLAGGPFKVTGLR